MKLILFFKKKKVTDSTNLEEIAKNVFDLCKDGFIDELKAYFRKVDKNTYERMLNQRDDETNKMTLLSV
jgi:type I restriction-modification system DNA methylase subunit